MKEREGKGRGRSGARVEHGFCRVVNRGILSNRPAMERKVTVRCSFRTLPQRRCFQNGGERDSRMGVGKGGWLLGDFAVSRGWGKTNSVRDSVLREVTGERQGMEKTSLIPENCARAAGGRLLPGENKSLAKTTTPKKGGHPKVEDLAAVHRDKRPPADFSSTVPNHLCAVERVKKKISPSPFGKKTSCQ